MIPWFEPLMTGGEADAVKAVLESGYLNDGPVTREFEQKVAAICERRFGVAVCNGTSAIALSLMACDIPAGSDVIVPAFTFIATANAVRLGRMQCGSGGYRAWKLLPISCNRGRS